jgi:hypothetical protein
MLNLIAPCAGMRRTSGYSSHRQSRAQFVPNLTSA